jgi:HK97 family phage major capsid protein
MTAPLAPPATDPAAPAPVDIDSTETMTVEELAAAIQAILDQAVSVDGDERDLTDDEVRQYEALEKRLARAQRSRQLRERNAARRAPVPMMALVQSGPKADNTLDRAYESYLRTGKANQDITHLRAQEVGGSASGGYTVPPGFRDKLVEVMKAYGGLAAEVESFNTTSGQPLEYPSLNDTANQGDIAAEGSAADGQDLTFGTVALGAYRYTSGGAGTGLPLRVSVELAQDSAFDIVRLVTRAMGTRIARKQAAHWCTGTGVAQPLGIVGNVTADETLDVSNTIDYDDISDVEGLLDPAYEQNAKWVMNKGTWTAIRQIVDTTGRPLILRNDESGIGSQPTKVLMGYPVVIDQAMPALTTATARFAVLGDLKEAYVTRRVQELVIVVDPYSRAVNGQIQYSGWERADGTVQNRSAYVVLRNV